MGSSKPPLIVIAGPTASGKSALALQLAEQNRGVLVNADATQVYRNLPILSASPTAQERGCAEHRLYGIFDGAQGCSAGRWAELARSEIQHIHAAGRLPILVGGTGLYLRTLLDGIAPVPEIDPGIRQMVRCRHVDENWTELRQVDAAAANRLGPKDSTRIARALEVALSTGRTLSEWQEQRSGGIGGAVALRPLILLPPREWLYARCDARFALMFESGAVQEVEALLGRGLSPALPIMRSIGVREIAAFLAGRASRDETVSAGQQATRRYAKRQYTWFKHQPPPEWPRFPEPLDRGSSAAALALLNLKA